MTTNPGTLPEIIFDTDTSFTPDAVGQLVRQGQVRKLGPKLYTSNLDDAPEAIVGRHIFEIAGHFYPGAVIGWRTALEEAPAADGTVYLSYHRARKVALPGHTLKLLQGPDALPGDRPYVGELLLASPARAFLENLSAARSRDRQALALPPEALEARLRAMGDPAARDRLRDRARELATQCRWEDEFRVLEELLDSVAAASDDGSFKAAWGRWRGVRQRSAKLRSSLSQVGSQVGGALGLRGGAEPAVVATPAREADYGVDRLRLFQSLFRVLRERTYAPRPRPQATPGWDINRAFFEAYFSNYLGGAEFDVGEAHEVILHDRPLAERPLDSGILLNTFRLISDGDAAAQRPANGHAFLDLLASRHAALFAGRDADECGHFRQPEQQTDKAGFVAPGLVRGTLLRGFELYRELQEPFTRAAFMLYLVRESHPFAEGSGRLARLMMNAEFSAAGETRILIPPVYCGDYWLALRALARQDDPEPYVRMLMRAHAFSAAIDFSFYETALAQLEANNAFMPPDKRNRVYEA